MRPRWSRPAQVLLDAGESIEEQIELLERAHCLNARARAERSAVVALLEQAARALCKADEQANGPTDLPPKGAKGDGAWLCDAVRDTLRASGYLDELAWAGVPRAEFIALCDELGFDTVRERVHRWAD